MHKTIGVRDLVLLLSEDRNTYRPTAQTSMSGKLFFSRLRNPKRILDIGTGTGIWAMEIGQSGKILSSEARLTSLQATSSHMRT